MGKYLLYWPEAIVLPSHWEGLAFEPQRQTRNVHRQLRLGSEEVIGVLIGLMAEKGDPQLH